MAVFHTASDVPRPVRLPEPIRQWAAEALKGKYGDEAYKYFAVQMDGVEGFAEMSPIEQYDAEIRLIAETAPLRICEHERVSGAATLGFAIDHRVPVTYGGEPLIYSVSHLTINYEYTLKYGINGYVTRIEKRLRSAKGRQKQLLESMLRTIESMRIWHARYLEALKNDKHCIHREEIISALNRVPFSPAESFLEAVQTIWFVFSFVRLCGNWPGIGRLDKMLGEYYRRDLSSGKITEAEAREILASFFIKGTEWIRSDAPRGSGDAQHYQNIVLCGIDEHGKEISNEVTRLILEVVEELPISDFPISLRLNADTPEEIVTKAAEVIRHGGGVVAAYDEKSIINGMIKCGYPESEARNYANDGCWEVQVPGATNFAYIPFDGLQIFNRAIGLGDGECRDFGNIEEVFEAFGKELQKAVDDIYRAFVTDGYGERGEAAIEQPPCTVIDIFTEGCIENAHSYSELGPKYTVRSPHLGGGPDVANSILAIRKLVFEQKLLSFGELTEALRENWEGREPLRLYAKNKIVYYGNDDDEADGYMHRVVEIFCDCVERTAAAHPDNPVIFIAGISTFGRQIEWAPARMATAFGAKKGEILSGNDSPTPGTDFAGATAIVKSYAKSNPARAYCGAALDLKISPESLKGENGVTALKALLRAVVDLGGSFVQIDTVDVETLRMAQKNPQAYKTLSVRVSGWNARFVTLNEEWQNMIIEKTCQRL